MNNELTKTNNFLDKISIDSTDHSKMLTVIKSNLPKIEKATKNFNKRQSQFMDNMLTVSHPSPIRNLRQILAEMKKSKEALHETYFKNEKRKIQAKILTRDAEKEEDELKRELLYVRANEINSNINIGEGYISGAIRKITNYIEQYNSILDSIGVDSFDEVDFEKEEERYHIMTVFSQALTAARSRTGTIDEGNHIYLQQIGINGAAAQQDIYDYLASEGKMMAVEKKQPSHGKVLTFLNKMANKYKGCSTLYAKRKGQTGNISNIAAITHEVHTS